jgi:solute carrier family 25 (mitochondrial carnitine/acylcarnitine transporter), member 20/29
MVRSALFPGLHRDGSGGNVHEWQLDSPSDMIEVFLLIKNIDHWTVNGFLECIERGIADLVDSVLTKGHPYQPWKRVGTLKASRTKEAPAAENSSSQPSAPPPVRRSRRRRSRPS